MLATGQSLHTALQPATQKVQQLFTCSVHAQMLPTLQKTWTQRLTPKYQGMLACYQPACWQQNHSVSHCRAIHASLRNHGKSCFVVG
jgi:hypothetical protein